MFAFRVSVPVVFFFSPAFSCDTECIECITGADTPTHKFLAQWAWTPPLVRHIGLRLHFLTALSGSGKSPEKIDPWTGATEKWSGEHRGQQLLFGFCLF